MKSLPKVSLRSINRENFYNVIGLMIKPEQRTFVAPNAKSIAEAHYNDNVYFKAIYTDESSVDFIMLADPCTFGSPTRYYLWRLMVDQHHQGQEYGKKALDLLCEYKLIESV